MKTLLAAAALFVSILFSCSAALADALPPEAIDCWAKKVGDRCTDRSTDLPGKCQYGTCTSVKFDAAPMSYECLTCVTGAPSQDDSGCTIDKRGTIGHVAPWLMAGLFSVLFLIGRRRRRR